MSSFFDPEDMRLPGRRIAVIGVTGSGKTTTASRLAQILAIPHVELDSLHWGPNWQPAEREIFRQRVDQALRGECWVTDGNYSKSRDILWSRADTVVWLNYGLPVILWQLFKRTMRRILTREALWNGNRETFFEQFFTRDSLFLWAVTTYPKHNREYPQLLASPEYAHLQLIRLRSPAETRRWLAELAGVTSPIRPTS